MKNSEVLRAALNLILSKPGAKAWTKGVWARDQYGTSSEPDNVYATSWCAMGACRRFSGHRGVPGQLFTAAESADLSPPSLNDRGSLWDVVAMFVRAIKLAEAAEAQEQK